MQDKSKLLLILHAHLPFVRHPEFDSFLEENWLFEAITECYIPLLSMLEKLHAEKINAKITFTLTPTLCAMLTDKLLNERFLKRLNNLLELAEKELERTKECPEFSSTAKHYHTRLNQIKELYQNIYQGNILERFRLLENSGVIEIMACAATHALLPLMQDTAAIKAQIDTGITEYKRHFNKAPSGFWLPECAYTSEIEKLVKDAGCKYTILDSHGIIYGTPRPQYAVYAPIETPSGLKAFARDPESSKQVWCAQSGYPGEAVYREFYRDLGWDAQMEYIQPHLVSNDLRHDTGFKYHRITGEVPLEQKEVYNPEAAQKQASEHARHFIESRIEQAQTLSKKTGKPPVIVAPYDAELFGHWWYEGPIFLEEVIRIAADTGLELATPSEISDSTRNFQPQTPSTSSWGNKGYFETWLNGTNDWILPLLEQASKEMHELVQNHPKPNDLEERALSQAMRELLLAQSSDWQFILTTGTMTDYAKNRVLTHLEHFAALDKMLSEKTLDEAFITDLESRNNLFPKVDYTIFI